MTMDGSISRVRLSDGSFRYRARYRDPGGRQHEKRFPRKVDAQRWLDEAASAMVTQTWTAPARGRVTVAAWASRWLDSQTGIKPSTLYRYGTLLRAHVLPAWGDYRLADVTHADVATWVARLRTQGAAPGTVRQAHRVFSLLLDLAVRDGRIPRNPAERVPLPRIVRGEPRFLTRDQVEMLADAAGEDGDVVRLLANTGLRFGELAALRVRRVDFLRKRLTIAESATEVAGELVFGTPKTHQQRTVPLPAELVEPLARRCEGKQPDDLLMTTPAGTPLRLRNWRRMVWNPAVEAAGLSGITPHDLRHTAASLAVASGAHAKSVQRMLGHASAAMTLDVYSGLFDDDLTALADRMDAAARAAAEARVGAVWARPLTERSEKDQSPGQRGGPRGDRTHNPRIKSPLLCQLS
jgi:integrase